MTLFIPCSDRYISDDTSHAYICIEDHVKSAKCISHFTFISQSDPYVDHEWLKADYKPDSPPPLPNPYVVPLQYYGPI